MLAAGCEDGSIRLISLWDGELEIVKKLDQVTTRLLSLAWGPQQAANKLKSQQNGKGKERAIDQSTIESPPTDVYLVAGCGDCAVRKWDVRSGRCISKMTTERTGKDPTLVWAVGVLHDHTIISGDSMGNVKFWDGYMGTQLQSLPAHKADILCLAIGPVSFSLKGCKLSKHYTGVGWSNCLHVGRGPNYRTIHLSDRRPNSLRISRLFCSPMDHFRT